MDVGGRQLWDDEAMSFREQTAKIRTDRRPRGGFEKQERTASTLATVSHHPIVRANLSPGRLSLKLFEDRRIRHESRVSGGAYGPLTATVRIGLDQAQAGSFAVIRMR
jgi:hypothetical protein